MKKVFDILIAAILIFSIGFTNKAQANSIPKLISDSGINKSAVSVSVKDVKTGKTVYEFNAKQPMMPASTLKLITYAASVDTLGQDYEFTTTLYKSTNNDLYLKLGADPYLTSNDLVELMSAVKKKNILDPKVFYIDDSIMDNNEWGEGWQWDDDLNPLMPKFSSYNIDKNILNVILSPTSKNAPASIRTSKFYPTTFMNLVVTGDINKISFNRQNHISPDMITVEGTVDKQTTCQIPVNNPSRYFKLRLEDAIRHEKVEYYKSFQQKKTPENNVYIVHQIKHPLSAAKVDILKNSNNLIAETVFKIAGGKYANNSSSQENSLKMLNHYFQKEGLNAEDIKIVDGSGVSKNNIMTADFMSSFLAKLAQTQSKENIQEALPKPGEGTLKNRMLYFKDSLHAKTGTLADVSAIAGYITTRNGKVYAFDIMINDPKSKSVDKKSLEEHILRAIHSNY